MRFLIKEYAGVKNDFKEITIPDNKDILTNLKEDLDPCCVSKNSLMVDIEAIHAYPYATRNFTRYMPECLKNSVQSWMTPYRRPMITFHNEQDGDIVGRFIAAEYVTKKTKTGTPALVFTVNIADPDAIEKVKSSIYETTSIGVIANTVKCSICGQDLTDEGQCEHLRGETYDDEICYWDIYDMEGKECSYVIVPSDIYSGNIKIYEPSGKEIKEGIIQLSPSSMHLTEGLNNNQSKKPKQVEGKSEPNMTEEEIKKLQADLKEAQDKNAAFEQSQKDLQEKFDTAEKDKKAAEDKLVETDKSLKESQEKATGVQKELEDAKTAVETEKALRESLEQQLQTSEKTKKNGLIETVVSLRRSVGKSEIAMDVLESRTVDSLNDSIKDLQEELRVKNFPNGNKPPKLEDPTLHESDDDKDKNKKAPDIDLKESFVKLFK